MKHLYSEKEMLMASNKSLAEFNLSQEEPLRQTRVRLQEKHREVKRAQEQVRKMKGQLEENTASSSSSTNVGSQNEPDTMLALLQAAHAEAEEESEQIADQLVKGGGDVDDFLKTYMV